MNRKAKSLSCSGTVMAEGDDNGDEFYCPTSMSQHFFTLVSTNWNVYKIGGLIHTQVEAKFCTFLLGVTHGY